jgi:dienelactone hydrolase
MHKGLATLSRRSAIARIAAGGLSPVAAAFDDGAIDESTTPFGWHPDTFQGQRVYSRGQGEVAVILLHELNGLSPGCVDFGMELVSHGFQVFMPLFFGHPMQDDAVLGYLESCVLGKFHCAATSDERRNTGPVLLTQALVEHVSSRPGIRGVGVIGMCLTGAFPIAAMKEGTNVKAVIMSQPATPFGNSKQNDVGIAHATMQSAKCSKIPILAFRFACDTICTAERFKFLEDYFGTEQFHKHVFDGPPGFHQTLTHRLHAVLTGPFGAVRECARAEAIRFLCDHLA